MREIELIQTILADATTLVREKFAQRDALSVSSKSHPTDLLTEVDVAVQRRVVAGIRAVFPDDAIVGEEEEFSRVPADPEARCWLIDPIDGTQNLVKGYFPAFCISVAFAEKQQTLAAGVCCPITGDVFLAAKGEGATFNGLPMQVSEIDRVSLGRLEADSDGPPLRKATFDIAGELMRVAGELRCTGSAALSLCCVAHRDLDMFFHVAINPWDYAAGYLVVEEAGGKVTRIDGTPMRLFDGQRSVMASNGKLHDEALSLLQLG